MRLTLGSDPKLLRSPVTRGLVILNVAVWVLGLAGDALGVGWMSTEGLRLGFGLFPTLVGEEGMFWTPFTHMFLHGGLGHLAMNMFGLLLLGPDLERAFGVRGYLVLYLGSGLAGGWGYYGISHLLLGKIMPCVGASGAIMGLLGATVALYPRRVYVILPIMLPMKATVLAVVLVTSHLFFLLTPYGGNVAYDVHLMGGGCGWAIAAWAAAHHRRVWKDRMPRREVPYAMAELELIAARMRDGDPPRSEAERSRIEFLLQALRFEDFHSDLPSGFPG